MANVSDSSAERQEKKALSCYQCKARKLGCDRIWPCRRCSQSGQECQFPESRQRPLNVVRRPRVKELEARLADLEHRITHAEPVQSPQSHPQSPWDDQLIQTGRMEQLPPQPLIDELMSLYFSRLHSEMPMQDPTRYLASLHLPSHMQPPMCLQYTILALAASLSKVHGALELPFYQRARNYLQFDEMKGDGHHVMTIGHVQCSVLLGNFEAQHLWFSRASLSVSKAVRLAQMLALHNLEVANESGLNLAPPKDWGEKEERRRTMWAVFCTDRLTSSTTGWPVLMDHTIIRTLLPASEENFQLGIEEPSITLHEALRDESATYSPFACRVLAAHLFHECFQHTSTEYPETDAEDVNESGFWKRHQELDNRLAIMFMSLPSYLRCPDNIGNHDAVFINLKLHTATICIQRVAVTRAKGNDRATRLLFNTGSRLLTAAQGIMAIVAILSDVDAYFLNPFVAFATYMAALVFLDDYIKSQSRQSEECLGALMNLMVVIANHNTVTASLAVQLAQELSRTGVDKYALHKVRHLASKMDPDSSLLGWQNHATGEVVFCPLEPRMGDAS